jgi:hypothetical protein
MDNLLLEVDEAMRWERIEKLWRAYGNYVLAFIGLTILATAIVSGWTAWNDHVKTKDTQAFVALLQDKNFPENVKPESLKMRPSLKGMAMIDAGAELLAKGKSAEAAALFTKTSQDHSIPAEVRDLGT